MQTFNAILAFVALYNVYSQVYPLLASDSCVAGIAIFIASAVIDHFYEDAILVVGVCLVVGEILAAQAFPGGIIFALQARNQDIHFVVCEEDSDTDSEPSFESVSDVTLVATTQPVPAIDPAVLKSVGLSAISVNNLIISSMNDILVTSASKAASQTPVPAALQNRRLASKPQAKSASSRINAWLSSQIKTPSARLPAITARSKSALKVVDVDVLDAVFDKWEQDEARGLRTSRHAPSNEVHLSATPSPSPPPSISAVAVSGHRSAGAAATSASNPPIATLKATPPLPQAPVSVPAAISDSSALEARLAIKTDALLPVTALLEAPDLTLETEWTPTVLVWQAPRRPTVQDYDGVGASRWSDARMHMRVDDFDTLMAADAEPADVTVDNAEDCDLDFLMYDAKDFDTIMNEVDDIDTVMYDVSDIDAIMDDGDASPT